MGLRDYKKYKFEKTLEESDTVKALKEEISALKKEIAQLKGERFVSAELTEEQKKKLKEQQNLAKPQDFIDMFTGDLQEFNPNAN